MQKLYLMLIWQPIFGKTKRSQWSKAFYIYMIIALIVSFNLYLSSLNSVLEIQDMTVRSGEISGINKRLFNSSTMLTLKSNNEYFRYVVHSIDLKNIKPGNTVKIYSVNKNSTIFGIKENYIEEIRDLNGTLLSTKYNMNNSKKANNIAYMWSKLSCKLSFIFFILIVLINLRNNEKPNNIV